MCTGEGGHGPVKGPLHNLANGLNLLASIGGFLIFALVLLSVVMRYIAGSPFRFTEEIVGLLFVSLSFLALPLAFIQGRNIRLGLLADRRAVRTALGVSALAAFVLFCGLLAKLMLDEALFSLSLDAKSELSDIPLFPWMIVPPVCLAIVILCVLVFGAERIFASNADEVEPPK